MSTAVSRRPSRIVWIDALRILGAALIFVYHFSRDYQFTFGMGAPAAGLAHVTDWFALVGISLFVVLSGLSYYLSRKPGPTGFAEYRRRIGRLLLPLWIIGVPYVAAGLAMGEMTPSELWKVPFWFLGLGVVSPATYLPVSSAWWYVTLAVQCVLVLPAIWMLTDRIGLTAGVIVLALVEFATLALIGLLPPAWHYLVQGLVFARLIEISVGIVAAAACRRLIGAWKALGLCAIAVAASLLAQQMGAITPAWIVGGWAVVTAGLALALGVGSHASTALLTSVATATYPFYLVHAPIVKNVIHLFARFGISSYALLMATAAVLSCLVTALVVWFVGLVRRRGGQAGGPSASERSASL